jgi:hypothetical protein
LSHTGELETQNYYSISFPSPPLHQYGKKLDELKSMFNQEDAPGNVKDLFGALAFISFGVKSLIKKGKS